MTSSIVHRHHPLHTACATRDADGAADVVPTPLPATVSRSSPPGARGVRAGPTRCEVRRPATPSSPLPCQPFDVFALEEHLSLPPSAIHAEVIDAILETFFAEVMCGAGPHDVDTDSERAAINTKDRIENR